MHIQTSLVDTVDVMRQSISSIGIFNISIPPVLIMHFGPRDDMQNASSTTWKGFDRLCFDPTHTSSTSNTRVFCELSPRSTNKACYDSLSYDSV